MCSDCVRCSPVIEIAPPRRVGRPTVLTDSVLAEIARLRGEGLGYRAIADAVGVGRTTVRRVLGKVPLRVGGQNSQEAKVG